MNTQEKPLSLFALIVSGFFAWLLVSLASSLLLMAMFENYNLTDRLEERGASVILFCVYISLRFLFPTAIGVAAFAIVKKMLPRVKTYWPQVGLTAAFYLGGIVGIYILNQALGAIGIDTFFLDQPIFFDLVSLFAVIPHIIVQSIVFPLVYNLCNRK